MSALFKESVKMDFATLDMISSSAQNLTLRSFVLKYDNTSEMIHRMAGKVILAYKKKHLNSMYELHTRSFDNNFENGNADQVVALVVKKALLSRELAFELLNDGDADFVYSWCWVASNYLVIKRSNGDFLTIPPILIMKGLLGSALIEMDIPDNWIDSKMKFRYPHAYKVHKRIV